MNFNNYFIDVGLNPTSCRKKEIAPLVAAGLVAASSLAGKAIDNSQAKSDWNAQNAYNDPSAQKQRWLQAGFNPYLMMQGTGSSQVQSNSLSSFRAPQQTWSQTANDVSTNLASVMQAKQAEASARVSNSEADFNDASFLDRLSAMKERVDSYKFDNQTKQLANEYLNRTMESRINEQSEREQLMWRNRLNAGAQGSLLELEKDIKTYYKNRIQPLEARKLSVDMNTALTSALAQMLTARAAWKNAGTSALGTGSQIRLNDASIGEIKEKTLNLVEDRQTKQYINSLNEATFNAMIKYRVAKAENESFKPLWDGLNAATNVAGALSPYLNKAPKLQSVFQRNYDPQRGYFGSETYYGY